MSLTNEELKQLLLDSDEIIIKSDAPISIINFIKTFNLSRGVQKVPTYILYYLYKVKFKTTLKKVGTTEFFRHFKKFFDSKRKKSQRMYLVEGIEITPELKFEAFNYAVKIGNYDDPAKRKKYKKKVIS